MFEGKNKFDRGRVEGTRKPYAVGHTFLAEKLNGIVIGFTTKADGVLRKT